MTKQEWNLDSFTGERVDIVLVGGPHPYLWIGDNGEGGKAIAVTSTPKQLRAIRDAVTKALRGG